MEMKVEVPGGAAPHNPLCTGALRPPDPPHPAPQTIRKVGLWRPEWPKVPKG